MTMTLDQHHVFAHGLCAHGELPGECTMFALRQATDHLVLLSDWIDESPANVARDPEAKLWGRVSKVGEEFGETIAALIGSTGQNPRKGVTGSIADVRKELFDVAVTALGAIEHIDGQEGRALPELFVFISSVWARAEATIQKDENL